MPLTVKSRRWASSSAVVKVTAPVTVTIDGPGTVAGIPTGPVELGTVVTLTATAAPGGYALNGWSGDASGVANPLNVLVDAPKAIAAHFGVPTGTPTVDVFFSNKDLAATKRVSDPKGALLVGTNYVAQLYRHQADGTDVAVGAPVAFRVATTSLPGSAEVSCGIRPTSCSRRPRASRPSFGNTATRASWCLASPAMTSEGRNPAIIIK